MTADKSNSDNNNNRIKAKNNAAIWPLIESIAIIGFSILLLRLRAIIPSFILMLVGISLIVYWIYITKMKNQGIKSKIDNRCLCAICEHTESSLCIQQKCVCCSIAKGDKVVGHSNNPLQ
ncbi:MAG: hypothetical protein L0H53_16790 [Candidatus Nitrosocosmicus sp.]|nr:hypothetical protein [Candidatus Nitrosocosmicus sp.]MDN5868037.1 hypothetical protein [Candidatus Nitrosocosmicus sp.]